MELRIAAEACIESSVKQGDLPAGVPLKLVPIEESLNALPVAELDDRNAGLLFEETTEARWTKTDSARELRKAVIAFIADQKARGVLDRRMHAAHGDLAGAIETFPRVQENVGEAGVQEACFVGCFGELGN